MLKIKSRAALAFAGLMVAAFVLVGTGSVSADMVSLPSAGVSKSSSMENIKNLQSFLNWTLGAQITPLVVDGIYGAKTTAAIKMYQAANGLVADGAFGPKSSAKAAALQAGAGSTTYPAGCASSTGYSSTTGMPCSGGTGTLPAGCASAAGYSVTTGQPCTSTTGISTGTNGYLADIASDSTNRVSTVYESESDKVVAGFRATARLSSQTVNRVRVEMRNTDTGGSSVNLAKYISSASLWYGSTKIATMAVAQADRSTSTDKYTFNFSGINAMIAQDQIGRFYVSVAVNGSLDSTDATNANWAVAFPDGGVQAVSPDGSTDTYNMSSGNVGSVDLTTNTGFTFGKFSANGVKATIALATSNPAAATIPVSATANTNSVTLLKFTIKATNSDLTLRKVPIQVTSSTADVASIINTIKIYNGANLLDSVDGSAVVDVNASVCDATDTTTVGSTGCYLFSNLSTPNNMISSGSTAEFSIVADLKKADGSNYSAGDTVTASLVNADALLTANLSVNDMNGDQLTAGSTYRVGSAIGQVQTLRVNGVNVVMGTPTYGTTTATSGDVTSVTYTVPLSVTSFGDTLYIGQTAQLAATASASNAFAFVFQNSSAPSTSDTSATATATLSTSDAAVETNGFRLDSGSTKHFTLIVTLTAPTTANNSYRVALKQVQTFTNGALSTGVTASNLLPVEQFQTNYQFINN